MPEELQNTNIVISGVEDTGQQIKIRDQNRRTYSFFKTKKDGGETVAFQDFRNFKIGDKALVVFKEVPYKEGTIRSAIDFRPATGEPTLAEISCSASRRRSSATGEERPTREYWEKREAKRQSSILMQVAFKAAVSLEAARLEKGEDEDLDHIYRDTMDFYDWMAGEIGEAQTTQASQAENNSGGEIIGAEELGF